MRRLVLWDIDGTLVDSAGADVVVPDLLDAEKLVRAVVSDGRGPA
jgi:phosphoglycolate phosphatase-like HAD superfamily hydrolase